MYPLMWYPHIIPARPGSQRSLLILLKLQLYLGRPQDPIVRHDLLFRPAGRYAPALRVLAPRGSCPHRFEPDRTASPRPSPPASRARKVGVPVRNPGLLSRQILVGGAAEEVRQPGAEQRAQGGRGGGDDGDIYLDNVEHDSDVMVRVAIRVIWTIKQLYHGNEADNADYRDASHEKSVPEPWPGRETGGPTLDPLGRRPSRQS